MIRKNDKGELLLNITTVYGSGMPRLGALLGVSLNGRLWPNVVLIQKGGRTGKFTANLSGFSVNG